MVLLRDDIIRNSATQDCRLTDSEMAVYFSLCALYDHVDKDFFVIDKRSIGKILFNSTALSSAQRKIISDALQSLGANNVSCLCKKGEWFTLVNEKDIKKILAVKNQRMRFALLKTYIYILTSFQNGKDTQKKIGHMSIEFYADKLDVTPVTIGKRIKQLKELGVLCVYNRGHKTNNYYTRPEDAGLFKRVDELFPEVF